MDGFWVWLYSKPALGFLARALIKKEMKAMIVGMKTWAASLEDPVGKEGF